LTFRRVFDGGPSRLGHKGGYRIIIRPIVVRRSAIEFRVAEHPSEFEQVSRLLYQTFVEEIPQHPPNPNGRHIDRFHDENQYVVAKSGFVLPSI